MTGETLAPAWRNLNMGVLGFVAALGYLLEIPTEGLLADDMRAIFHTT